MGWIKNGTPVTLASPAGLLTISDLTAKKFNMILSHTILATGNGTDFFRFDNNSNTDYSARTSFNNGADGTVTSGTGFQIDGASLLDSFSVQHILNISGEEKLVIAHNIFNGVVGAATAPQRAETVAKCDTTTNSVQFTRLDLINNHGTPTDYNAGSNLTALGTD